MMLSVVLIAFVAFNMALDGANAQFFVDIEHSMPRIGKRDQLNTHHRPQIDILEQQEQPQGVVMGPQRAVNQAAGTLGAEETNRANNVALLRQILSLMNENLQSQIETAAADSAYVHPYYNRFRPTNDDYSDKTFRLIKYLRKKIHTLQQRQQQEQRQLQQQYEN